LKNGQNDIDFNIILTNIRVASLSLLIVPLINFYRGYLQGHLKILPTVLSLILENLFKVILILSVINIFNFSNLKYALYFELFGYILAFSILFIFVYKDYKLKKVRFNALYNLIKSTILYGIVTLFFTFYTFIDTLTLSNIGIESGVYTAYMFEAIRIVFLPVTLAQSIGSVLNPKINSLIKTNKHNQAVQLARKSTNAAIIILIPLISILKLYSKEIYEAFYHSGDNYMVLYHLSDLILFIGFYKVLIGILNPLPKFNYIVITTFISVLSKLILNYVLGIKLGYLGVMYSTIISITICILIAYYILYDAKVRIFINNLANLTMTIAVTFLSFFISIIYRSIYLYHKFTFIVEMLLYSIIFIGIYMAIVTGIIWFKKSTKELNVAYTSVGCDRCE
jgi:O-antigen/teichoic acid export membrane protein